MIKEIIERVEKAFDEIRKANQKIRRELSAKEKVIIDLQDAMYELKHLADENREEGDY